MSEMSELIRKMGLFGIGVIYLTEEKIEEFTQEMIKKGEMNRDEGKKFVREVLCQQEKQLKDVEDKINRKIQETFEKSGIVMKSDIENLQRKIEELERTVESIARR